VNKGDLNDEIHEEFALTKVIDQYGNDETFEPKEFYT
jgi:hypothetical protein